MNRNQALDGLRGVAVLMVFLYHTIQKPAAGNLGVDIFFVLSGYLITAKLIEELDASSTVGILRFYVSRCLRLLPAFFVMCMLYEGLHYCFPGIVSLARPLPLLAFLFTSNLYWMHGAQPFPIASHTWTLATEWQFYLVWPIVASYALRVRRHRTSTAVALISLAIGLMVVETYGVAVPKFEGILIGAAMAILLSQTGDKRLPFRNAGVALAATAGAIGLVFLAPKAAELSSIAAIALSGIAIYAMTTPGQQRPVPVLSGDLLNYFGRISYGLYIYHFPIVAVAYVAGQSPMHMFLIGTVVSIPLADFSFRFVEEPAMKLRRLMSKRKVSSSNVEGHVTAG